ncbi:hypothetical protein SISSUDRAFT_1045801 [Sistotremastrum suecicum HHB10207 ss-3]|uniref:DUF6535 domain-containing protein n=1 Tax=Sistotremastrum suecicum HHB10207 ss-3 TaxID=1314776 RepID=A0A166E931_9AGAM|nr:hypothetical protein SISSUDRAFT_1045801 [Sistotremastrum suecicum HHB10207 ss-3]
MPDEHGLLERIVQLMEVQTVQMKTFSEGTKERLESIGRKIDNHREEYSQKQDALRAGQSENFDALRTEHGKSLAILATEAVKDTKAYTVTSFVNGQAWVALRTEAVVQIKKRLDEWQGLTGPSLIFLAIFLAIVTAFIVLSIQSLSMSSSNPLPSAIDLFSLFYYILSLTCGMLDGVMSMLGNQWASGLATLPASGTSVAKTIALERRRVAAESLLFSQIGYLIGVLVSSILFFLLGFLLQVFSTALFGFEKKSWVVLLAGSLATAMCGIVAGIFLWTTKHAMKNEESPFRNPLSTGLIAVSEWILRRKRMLKDEEEEKADGETDLFRVDDRDRTHVLLTKSERGVPDEVTMEMLKVYARLVTNASETELLDKVVPSFSFDPWYQAGDDVFPIFEAIYTRFSETDTSLRVKATLAAHVEPFWNWLVRQSETPDNLLIRWCTPHFVALYHSSSTSEPFRFRVLLTFLKQLNDPLPWSTEPRTAFRDCVATVVRSYNIDLHREYHTVYEAIRQCESFARDGYLISEDDQLNIVNELIRCPDWEWDVIKPAVSLIVRGMDAETLLIKLTNSISLMPAVDNPKILRFLADLAQPDPSSPSQCMLPSLPHDFRVPQGLDLSSILSLFHRFPPSLLGWRRHRDAFNFYFDRGAIDQLSITTPAILFLNRCRDKSLGLDWDDDENTSLESRMRADKYFNDLKDQYPELSNPNDAIYELCRYRDNAPGTEESRNAFAQAVNRCNFLLLTDNYGNFQQISSHNHLSIIISLSRSNMLDWLTIEPFFLYISKQNPTVLHHVMDHILRFDPDREANEVNGDLPVFDILDALHARDIPLPPTLDLTPLYALVSRQKPHWWNWRKYSKILMHYLHRDAHPCEHLPDPEAARKFCEACIDTPGPQFLPWDHRKATNADTRRLATEYLEKLNERRAATSQHASAQPISPSELNSSSPLPEHPSSTRNMISRGWRALLSSLNVISRKTEEEKILSDLNASV